MKNVSSKSTQWHVGLRAAEQEWQRLTGSIQKYQACELCLLCYCLSNALPMGDHLPIGACSSQYVTVLKSGATLTVLATWQPHAIYIGEGIYCHWSWEIRRPLLTAGGALGRENPGPGKDVPGQGKDVPGPEKNIPGQGNDDPGVVLNLRRRHSMNAWKRWNESVRTNVTVQMLLEFSCLFSLQYLWVSYCNLFVASIVAVQSHSSSLGERPQKRWERLQICSRAKSRPWPEWRLRTPVSCYVSEWYWIAFCSANRSPMTSASPLGRQVSSGWIRHCWIIWSFWMVQNPK